MRTESADKHVFSRRPLSGMSKATSVALLIMGLLCGTIWGFTGGDAIALLIIAIVLLVGAGLVATGVRWMPLLGTLMGVGILISFAQQPYVAFHLTQPTRGIFAFFVIILVILACAILALVAGIGATVQNYRRGELRMPGWFRYVLTGIVGIVLGAMFIGAIAQPVVNASATTTNGVPTVHMGPGSFVQSSVTIPKGSKLMLVDDGGFTHILANGSWQNGQPEHASEAGAPVVNNVQVSGGSVEIGPFTTAGTYHIYCTVHPGMNLTVIVQ